MSEPTRGERLDNGCCYTAAPSTEYVTTSTTTGGAIASLSYYIYPISAPDRERLTSVAARHRDFLETVSEQAFPYVCFDLCKQPFDRAFRMLFVCLNRETVLASLTRYLEEGRVSEDVVCLDVLSTLSPQVDFHCPSVTADQCRVHRQLLEAFPVYRYALNSFSKEVQLVSDWSGLERLEGSQTLTTSDVGFELHVGNQAGLARLFESFGVVASAVSGCGAGEASAACLSGAISAKDCAKLVGTWSTLARSSKYNGGVLFGNVTSEEARGLISREGFAAEVSVAVEFTPTCTIVAGNYERLSVMRQRMEEKHMDVVLARASFPLCCPHLDNFKHNVMSQLRSLKPLSTKTPLYSGCSAKQEDSLRFDADRWFDVMRKPVRVEPLFTQVKQAGHSVVLILGELSDVAASRLEVEVLQRGAQKAHAAVCLREGKDELFALTKCLAVLHGLNVDIQWSGIYPLLATATAAYDNILPDNL